MCIRDRNNKVLENGTPPKGQFTARLGRSAFCYTGVCFFPWSYALFASSSRRPVTSFARDRSRRASENNKVLENGTPPKRQFTARLGRSAFCYTSVPVCNWRYRYPSFFCVRVRRPACQPRRIRRRVEFYSVHTLWEDCGVRRYLHPSAHVLMCLLSPIRIFHVS